MEAEGLSGIYRFYPGENRKNRPAYFSKELCLRSFLRAWRQLGVRRDTLYILVDAREVPPRIRDVCERIDAQFICLGGVGNCESYVSALELAAGLAGERPVFMSEDDYLYQPSAFQKLLTAMTQMPSIEYFTLYDHPDRYTRMDDAPFRKREVYATENHHWRTVESSCMSFGCRPTTIAEDRNILVAAARPGSVPRDRAMWHRLQGIGRFAYHLRRRTLVSPVPALCTHMEQDYLAPAVDWRVLAQSISESNED